MNLNVTLFCKEWYEMLRVKLILIFTFFWHSSMKARSVNAIGGIGGGGTKNSGGPSKLNLWLSKLNLWLSKFDVWPSKFDVWPSKFDVWPSKFDAWPSSRNDEDIPDQDLTRRDQHWEEGRRQLNSNYLKSENNYVLFFGTGNKKTSF